MRTGIDIRLAGLVAMVGAGMAALPIAAQQEAPAARARGAGSPAVGKWDITVHEGDGTFPCWLRIMREDGVFKARFLGRAGGVGDIGENDFSVEGDTVKFNAWGREWTGTVQGNKIEGTWKHGNGEGKWIATRFVNTPDVTGKWELEVGDDRVTLTLSENNGKLEGTWQQDGESIKLENAETQAENRVRQRGNRVVIALGKRLIRLTVKGDAMEGSQAKRKQVHGRRQREWAKPVVLFGGQENDLKENWEPLGKGDNWRVIDGIMTNGKTLDPDKASHHGTENIVTRRDDFKNFKLHVEFMVPPQGNSGIYLRGRHEVQVEDSHGKGIGEGSCGAVYSRIVPSTNACKPAGEWQTYEITLIGHYVTVVLNGQTIIDNQEIEGITGGAIDSRENEPGPIYLQGDHSQIFYRKIVLTPTK